MYYLNESSPLKASITVLILDKDSDTKSLDNFAQQQSWENNCSQIYQTPECCS